MEGLLLAVPVSENGGKKPWHTDFVKFDDISAQLLGFADKTQAELKWKLHLNGADVATPVAGDPKHANAPSVDETPHCFYAHEVTACGHEIIVFLSAPDEETKKAWMKCLLQAAKDGPRPPRFHGALSPRSAGTGARASQASQAAFCFEARVTQVRLHSDGKHAEYMVTCHVSVFSRVADRRLTKEWNVWHRFSEFDALNEALKASLGADKMADVPFFKTHKDAIRSLFGWWSLDQDFLDHRRLQLDTFVSRVCAIEGTIDFFQSHSEPNLKKFFEFDEHCEDVDHSPRKTSQAKSPGSKHKEVTPPATDLGDDVHLRTSDMSPRDSDNTSASFSSAIMSPIAAPTDASPAPSPSKKDRKASLKASEVSSPRVDPAKDDTPAVETSKQSKPSRRASRKKGKSKEMANATKHSEHAAATGREVEVVRQPTPTGSKTGSKN